MHQYLTSICLRSYAPSYTIPSVLHYLVSIVSQLQITAALLLYSSTYLDFNLEENLNQAACRLLQGFILDQELVVKSSEPVRSFMEKFSIAYTIFLLGFSALIILCSFIRAIWKPSFGKVLTALAQINLQIMFFPILNILGSQITKYHFETVKNTKTMAF